MSINPEIAGRIQGGRFVPGVSGNPAGKPPGARARATRLAEKLMSGDAEAVVRAVVNAAKGGDMTAAKIILDRIAPPCRGRPVRLDLPPIVGAADLVRALAAVADAMARGVLSAEEAQAAAAVLEHHRKAVETLDLERRIAAIETKV
jgi:Family of unknown function (DUF5681)